MTDHQRRIIDAYKSGLSLRQTAQKFGISFQRVNAIIEEKEPEALRTWLFNRLSRGKKSPNETRRDHAAYRIA